MALPDLRHRGAGAAARRRQIHLTNKVLPKVVLDAQIPFGHNVTNQYQSTPCRPAAAVGGGQIQE